MMFGSKLRSWMENHIVRPRRKGNKNKNSNGNTTADYSEQDSHKTNKSHVNEFTTYHGNGTTTTASHLIAPSQVIVAPACNIVISSPARRSEVSPIQSHTQSRYGWYSPDKDIITSPKSDHFLYAPQRPQSHHNCVRVCHTTPNSKENSHTDKLAIVPQHPDCSSSSISSLSWSTGSKDISLQLHSTLPSAKPTNIQVGIDSTAELVNLDQDNTVHYEEISTILRHRENVLGGNKLNLRERPKSEQLSNVFRSVKEDDVLNRYGKLLPSKLAFMSSGSVDSLNANQLQGGSVECIMNYTNCCSGTSNNCVKDEVMHYPNIKSTNNVETPNPRTWIPSSYYNNSMLIRTHCGIGVPLHSLSSPESAYSTGYSTDGTSPGAIYTPPEYYINMRTGTHYFPKSVNSLAIETKRYKYGLNKIEEMSPIDPLPKTSFANAVVIDKRVDNHETQDHNSYSPLQLPSISESHSPLAVSSSVAVPIPKAFESSSPRQRCRIRTNPWYSTSDAFNSGATLTAVIQHLDTPADASKYGSSSSIQTAAKNSDVITPSFQGIKSTNDAENSNRKHNRKPAYDSSESLSSSTEIENVQKQNLSNMPQSIRDYSSINTFHSTARRGYCMTVNRNADGFHYQDMLMSDEDATLNEMMGKFDESYVYEKETDILSSNSDPTEYSLELDTGQDAGDEYDTEELIDIDFIDNSSIQYINDKKEPTYSSGSCYYFNSPPCTYMYSRKGSRTVKNLNVTEESGSSHRRRKRYLKTRKKGCGNRQQLHATICESRVSRSVGGTPVCLRRNALNGNERNSSLSNRSSSLIFSNVRDTRCMNIAESAKVLLKADSEADAKYRQLILEAESIIMSLRNSVQSIPPDTPRRVNPLVNKRVEMLKNCEAEIKREQLKQPHRHIESHGFAEHESAAVINKRIELIRHETASAPNSPITRIIPRKTHLTNFINQNNVPPDIPPRALDIFRSPLSPLSPRLHVNCHQKRITPSGSPRNLRRFRNQSPKQMRKITSRRDSDSDTDKLFNNSVSSYLHRSKPKESTENYINKNYLPQISRVRLFNESDCNNSNIRHVRREAIDKVVKKTTASNSLAPYSSIYFSEQRFYCPQSEPLKRKVYKGSSTYERIQKSFDLDSDTLKKNVLAKIHHLRRRDQQQHHHKYQVCTVKPTMSPKTSSHDLNHSTNNLTGVEICQDEDISIAANLSISGNMKKQRILSTITDLKRSLENQSVELNGLSEN